MSKKYFTKDDVSEIVRQRINQINVKVRKLEEENEELKAQLSEMEGEHN